MIKYPTFVRKVKDILNPSLDYNYIKSYNLPEIHAPSVNSKEFRKALIKLNPDIMLVGSWGEKFEKETYDIPKIASINAHPSLLPKYRGPNPYFWVIKNQEQTSGVTFHLIDEGYDSGAILAQEEVKIYPSDTGESLKQRTVLTARGVVCELLKDLSEDIIIPLQQREENATYFSHPDELELNFKKSAEENLAAIKAIHPWNRAYFYHKPS
jgi:methionyl-tRNA formyltransferase